MKSKNITKIFFVVAVITAAFVVVLPLFGASWVYSNPGFYDLNRSKTYPTALNAFSL